MSYHNKNLTASFTFFLAGFFGFFLVFILPLVYFMSPHIAAYTYDWAVLFSVMAFFALAAYIVILLEQNINSDKSLDAYLKIVMAAVITGVFSLGGVYLLTANDGEYARDGVSVLAALIVAFGFFVIWKAYPAFKEENIKYTPLILLGLLGLLAVVVLGITYTHIF